MAPSERAAISDHSETMLMMGRTGAIIFIVFVVAECQMELVVFSQLEKWVGCKLFNYPPSLVSHRLSVCLSVVTTFAQRPAFSVGMGMGSLSVH